MHDPAHLALWRNRDYVVLWSGQLISVLGSRISEIGLPLLILALIRSPAQAGTVAAVLGLPYLLFGLLAGVLIDRWNRKRTMLICEAVNGIATATIPLALWTGHFSMPQLYVMALVTGIAFVFFNVAEIAALPGVVTADQFPAAVGQNQAIFSVGGMAGPPPSRSGWQHLSGPPHRSRRLTSLIRHLAQERYLSQPRQNDIRPCPRDVPQDVISSLDLEVGCRQAMRPEQLVAQARIRPPEDVVRPTLQEEDGAGVPMHAASAWRSRPTDRYRARSRRCPS